MVANLRRNWLLMAPLLVLYACGPTIGQPGAPTLPTPTRITPPTGPVPSGQAGACPDPADTPATGGSYQLPTDASWARICGTSVAGTGTDPGPDGEQVLLGPPDALVSNLDGLIEFANRLPKADPEMACTMEFGPAYTLVVGYPDGSIEQLTGELFGCAPIGDRIGARQLLDDFGNRLRAQRDAFPTLAPTVEPCADEQRLLGDFFVQPSLAQTSTAYVNALGIEYDHRALRELLEWPQLRDAILADSRPHQPEPDPSADTTSFGPAVAIDAVNPQCEALTLQLTAEGLWWQQPGDRTMMFWQPDAASREILQPYLDWADNQG